MDGSVAVLDGVGEERPPLGVDVVDVGDRVAGLQEEESEKVRLVVQPPVEEGAHGRQGRIVVGIVRLAQVEAEAEKLVNAVQHVGKRLPRAAWKKVKVTMSTRGHCMHRRSAV